jgi:hypothetical protein
VAPGRELHMAKKLIIGRRKVSWLQTTSPGRTAASDSRVGPARQPNGHIGPKNARKAGKWNSSDPRPESLPVRTKGHNRFERQSGNHEMFYDSVDIFNSSWFWDVQGPSARRSACRRSRDSSDRIPRVRRGWSPMQRNESGVMLSKIRTHEIGWK